MQSLQHTHSQVYRSTVLPHAVHTLRTDMRCSPHSYNTHPHNCLGRPHGSRLLQLCCCGGTQQTRQGGNLTTPECANSDRKGDGIKTRKLGALNTTQAAKPKDYTQAPETPCLQPRNARSNKTSTKPTTDSPKKGSCSGWQLLQRCMATRSCPSVPASDSLCSCCSKRMCKKARSIESARATDCSGRYATLQPGQNWLHQLSAHCRCIMHCIHARDSKCITITLVACVPAAAHGNSGAA